MSLRGLVLLLVLALTGCGVERVVEGSPVDRFLDDNWPAGADGAVAVADGGELVTCRGFGFADRETGVESGCDTVYDIGSITKAVTGTAIVLLESRGELAFDDSIGTFFDGVPADRRGITVHHLLTHTSGLPESLGDDYDPLTRAGLIDAAMRAPLTPGGGYQYSNVGFSLLAAIIELVSGTSYETFLAEHLFAPAGMTSTGYVLPDWEPSTVAVEYDEHGMPQGKPAEHPWADDGPYWNLRGNGGLLSTPRDLYRWHVALTGDTLLDDQAKKRMFTPRVEDDGAHTGYAWSVLDTEAGRLAGHTGGNGWSFAAYARFLDSDRLVFLVSNHALRQGEWDVEAGALDLIMGLVAAVPG
ncbi:serine hydrolase domain-containing protein [Actinophytocola sediminis]